MTSRTPGWRCIHCSPWVLRRSSVKRASARGHGFDFCRGLWCFFCPTLVPCWSVLFSHHLYSLNYLKFLLPFKFVSLVPSLCWTPSYFSLSGSTGSYSRLLSCKPTNQKLSFNRWYGLRCFCNTNSVSFVYCPLLLLSVKLFSKIDVFLITCCDFFPTCSSLPSVSVKPSKPVTIFKVVGSEEVRKIL